MSSEKAPHSDSTRWPPPRTNLFSAAAEKGRLWIVLLAILVITPSTRSSAQLEAPTADSAAAKNRLGPPQLEDPHPDGTDRTVAGTAEKIEAQIAETGPTATLYSQLGLARYRNHQPDKSLNAFTTMLKFRQPNADELRIVALDYVELRDLQSADKWLRASLKLNPTDWRTWRYLGGVQFSEEHVADAVESFRECLKLDPQNALAEDGLARSLAAQEKVDEAEKHFELSKQLNLAVPTPSPLPPLHFGEFLYRQQHMNEALEELKEASKLDPHDSETHEYLSYVYMQTGDNPQAIVEMRQASQLHPDSPRLHFLLSRLYRNAGNLAESTTEINRYVQLSRQHKEEWDR